MVRTRSMARRGASSPVRRAGEPDEFIVHMVDTVQPRPDDVAAYEALVCAMVGANRVDLVRPVRVKGAPAVLLAIAVHDVHAFEATRRQLASMGRGFLQPGAK